MRIVRIGVDTGGTFTDFVISENGRLSTKKLPSTPDDPSRAILEGLREYLEAGPGLVLIHGTTVATNALLERKGSKIALVTTKGFEDILSIGRQTRRLLYSLKGEPRIPLVQRDLCFGIAERTTADGTVERTPRRPPSEPRPDARPPRRRGRGRLLHQRLRRRDKRGGGRRRARAARPSRLRLLAPSSGIPRIRAHVDDRGQRLPDARPGPVPGIAGRRVGQGLLVYHAVQRGYISPRKARKEPIRTALSGPAGGVVGSLELARAAGFPEFISFDMGGTSTDVSLVDGDIRRTNENTVGDFPIRLPIIDIHSVGAGGGSIAHIDSGGSLRVGPRSAGADPGPACYGRGEDPTVTDADLVLGRIDPDYFLGGRMVIEPERSRAAIGRLAVRIRKTTLETAQGIVDIANANMEKAIRVISLDRGFDPREFALLSFGGAGGMHAADLAASLRMKAVLAPQNAGVLSAFGLLLADSIKDYSRSVLKTVEKADPAVLERGLQEMEKRGRRDLAEDGFALQAMFFERSVDLRYLGQSYEINVPFPPGGFKSLAEEFSPPPRKNLRLPSRPGCRGNRDSPGESPGRPARSVCVKSRPVRGLGRRRRAENPSHSLPRPGAQGPGLRPVAAFAGTPV